jgi:hypothetical protein
MSRAWIRSAVVVALSLGLSTVVVPAAHAQVTAGIARGRAAAGLGGAAQGQPGAAPAVPVELDRRSADELRNDFRAVMRQYPPALGEVLKLDPILMTNAAYLQTYPALAAFLDGHPEVARYPAFFLDYVRTADDQSPYDNSPAAEQVRLLGRMIESVSIGTVMLGFALTLTWLVRHLLAHRRWLRATKLQMDLHNRLMERLSSSADVQTYLESAASNRLLADVPLMSDGAGPRMGAPINRILWSVQAGIVVAAGGVGLMLVRRYLEGHVEEVLILPAVLAMAIGIGFILAAGASYILSARLGLLDADPARRPGPDRA